MREAGSLVVCVRGLRGRGSRTGNSNRCIFFGVSEYALPPDLVDIQQQLHQAQHALRALYRAQPSWAKRSQLPEAFESPWPEDALPLGLTREDHEQQRRLEARVVDLAARAHSHSFWSTLSGPDVPAARDALKQIARDSQKPGAEK